MKHSKFADFLFNQTPFYDELIIQDVAKPHIINLPVDVRLLPNRLRRIYTARGPERKCAKRFRVSLWKFRDERERASCLLQERLHKWLKRLPKKKRVKERKLRWYDPMGRVGQIDTGCGPKGVRE